MINKIKTEVQLFFVILFVGITLTMLSLFLESSTQAQSIEPTPEPVLTIDEETLAAFGLASTDLEALSADPFNLAVSKTSSHSAVDAGTTVTFNIAVTNHGPNAAVGVFLQDQVPDEMENIVYSFSPGAGEISNGATDPQEVIWLFTNPIAMNDTVMVTVSGMLTSTLDVTVTNAALITTFTAGADTTPSNNYSAVDVGIAGSDPDAFAGIYLPVVNKFPTPTPIPIILAYSENFNSSDAWVEFDSNGCDTDNSSGQYWVNLDKEDKECFPPARDEDKPDSPYRTYGEFEVKAYHSEGSSDAAYGIFINGEGGENYYLFRIWPNNGCSSGGDWELIRAKEDEDNDDNDGDGRFIILSKDCDTNIIRGNGSSSTNVLRIAHENTRQLTLYINGVQVGAVIDSVERHRTGEATGVYVRSDDVKVLMKFDDFIVYRFP